MNLELTLRIIDAVCTLIQAKSEMDSIDLGVDSDDLGDVIDITLRSIIVAYRRNDRTALEMILDRAESLTELM